MYIEAPGWVGRVLHSCNPNSIVDMRYNSFTARRNIKRGEFVTMDYDTTEDELFRPFECHCNAVNCRGFIQGRNSQLSLLAS
ncbi:MAG: hypothetical protein HQK84_07150 [Nitrospinae bacterium]|nr:hypothetical protein [Nitrospinota bacterium]